MFRRCVTGWCHTFGDHPVNGVPLSRPGNDEIQLDLFLDYASNVALYPKFQEYFRIKRPSGGLASSLGRPLQLWRGNYEGMPYLVVTATKSSTSV
jgi:hypothetical protein